MKMKYSVAIALFRQPGFPAATLTPLFFAGIAALVLVATSGCASASGAAPAQPPEILSVRQALTPDLSQRTQPRQCDRYSTWPEQR